MTKLQQQMGPSATVNAILSSLHRAGSTGMMIVTDAFRVISSQLSPPLAGSYTFLSVCLGTLTPILSWYCLCLDDNTTSYLLQEADKTVDDHGTDAD